MEFTESQYSTSTVAFLGNNRLNLADVLRTTSLRDLSRHSLFTRCVHQSGRKTFFLRAGTFHCHVSMSLKRTILFKASHAEGN